MKNHPKCHLGLHRAYGERGSGMEVTIDDFSPEIKWAGDWVASNTSISDQFVLNAPKYRGTSHTCSGAGDQAVLSFRGVGVSVYGHSGGGEHIVEIDGVLPKDSVSDDGGLWMSPSLPDGIHHNLDDTTYIDYFVIHGPIIENATTQIIDDRSPQFQYHGVDSWLHYENDKNEYLNNTWMFTRDATASAELAFLGSSVQVLGSVDVGHGGYSVSLDGGDLVVYEKDPSFRTLGLPLYTATGLSEGEHTLEFRNIQIMDRRSFSIDYAVVNSSISSTSSTDISEPFKPPLVVTHSSGLDWAARPTFTGGSTKVVDLPQIGETVTTTGTPSLKVCRLRENDDHILHPIYIDNSALILAVILIITLLASVALSVVVWRFWKRRNRPKDTV